MDVKTETIDNKAECINNESSTPASDIEHKEEDVQFTLEENDDGLVMLGIDGCPEASSNPETMTYEEVKNYILDKLMEYIDDPSVNPLLSLEAEAKELQEDLESRYSDLEKLKLECDKMSLNQMKFLKHQKIIPAQSHLRPCTEKGVHIDLPYLTDAAFNIPSVKSEPKPSTSGIVLPKGTTMKPAAANDLKKQNNFPASGKVECIDLTDEPSNKSLAVEGYWNGENLGLTHGMHADAFRRREVISFRGQSH